jgi:DNA-directed RNA polymerase specialized sigma24 family protein
MLLEKLPEVDACAFTLVFLNDYSYEEAAQMLKVSNATLRSRLRAAKRVLRAELLLA